MNSSIGIIGGADGPTAIFTAVTPGVNWLPVSLVLLLAAGVLFIILRRKKK